MKSKRKNLDNDRRSYFGEDRFSQVLEPWDIASTEVSVSYEVRWLVLVELRSEIDCGPCSHVSPVRIISGKKYIGNVAWIGSSSVSNDDNITCCGSRRSCWFFEDSEVPGIVSAAWTMDNPLRSIPTRRSMSDLRKLLERRFIKIMSIYLTQRASTYVQLQREIPAANTIATLLSLFATQQ